jgi:hypothetical protein
VKEGIMAASDVSAREMVEMVGTITQHLKGIADRLEAALGPPPRPELKLVETEDDDDA